MPIVGFTSLVMVLMIVQIIIRIVKLACFFMVSFRVFINFLSASSFMTEESLNFEPINQSEAMIVELRFCWSMEWTLGSRRRPFSSKSPPNRRLSDEE